jgi:hypothetical protein
LLCHLLLAQVVGESVGLDRFDAPGLRSFLRTTTIVSLGITPQSANRIRKNVTERM